MTAQAPVALSLDLDLPAAGSVALDLGDLEGVDGSKPAVLARVMIHLDRHAGRAAAEAFLRDASGLDLEEVLDLAGRHVCLRTRACSFAP